MRYLRFNTVDEVNLSPTVLSSQSIVVPDDVTLYSLDGVFVFCIKAELTDTQAMAFQRHVKNVVKVEKEVLLIYGEDIELYKLKLEFDDDDELKRALDTLDKVKEFCDRWEEFTGQRFSPNDLRKIIEDGARRE